MASVGEKLRAARLDQGLELPELAARTKISPKFLAAIESDDRQSIPGGFFYRSWSQQYARALSLDPALITAEIDQILSNDQAPRLPGQRSASMSEMKPARMTIDRRSGGGNRLAYSFALLVAVVLGCSGLYAWWHKATQEKETPVDRSSTVATPAVVSKQSAPTPQPAPSTSSPTLNEGDQVSKTVEPPAVQRNEPDVQVEVSATQQTWISISGDGKESFSGILYPAEIKTVAARDMARIRVGNAGGLQVRLNGKPIGPIGLAGQARTVIINKAGFQILEAKPAA